MSIVTPSHSNDNTDDVNGVHHLATTTTTSSMTTTTHNNNNNNKYFDAIWLHGRSLTHTEWDELQLMKTTALRWQDAVMDTNTKEPPIQPQKTYVRYIGMIQDMMETEYFTTTPLTSIGSNATGTSNSSNISERTPMMLVTIPSIKRYTNRNTTNPSADEQQRLSHNNNNNGDDDMILPLSKRMRLDMMDTDAATTAATLADENQHGADDGVVTNIVANFYFDQYPTTTTATTIQDMTDESRSNNNTSEQHRSKVQLNQMVEVIGILEDNVDAIDDTMEEDDNDDNAFQQCHRNFPNERNDALMNDNNSSVNHKNCNMNYTSDHPELTGGAFMTRHRAATTNHRMHVLWYRIVNFDDDDMDDDGDTVQSSAPSSSLTTTMMNGTSDGGSLSSPTTTTVSPPPTSLPLLIPALMNIATAIPRFGTTRNSNGSTDEAYWHVVSQAIWIILHSKAEPQPPVNGTNNYSNTMKPILGCASLNLVLPTDTDNHDNDTLAAVLINTIQTLVQPHCCHVIQPSQQLVQNNDHCYDNQNNGAPIQLLQYLQSPQKLFGRMGFSALQLPAGSTLIIDIRSLQSVDTTIAGSTNSSTDSCRMDDDTDTTVTTNYENPNHPLYAIRQICRTFQLPFKFDGGIEIPFLADYRVIVISNQSTQHLIPCTMTVQSPPLSTSLEPFIKNGAKYDPSVQQQLLLLRPVRDAIRKNRSKQSSASAIRLHETVIERAQQDFCDRRRQWFKNNTDRSTVEQNQSSTTTTANVVPPNTRMIGEEDFHRWLTLCRIMARCRGVAVAGLMDWENALLFDDAVVRTMVAK